MYIIKLDTCILSMNENEQNFRAGSWLGREQSEIKSYRYSGLVLKTAFWRVQGSPRELL